MDYIVQISAYNTDSDLLYWWWNIARIKQLKWQFSPVETINMSHYI